MRIWILGMETAEPSAFSSLERGCKIARAALVADDSNYQADLESWMYEGHSKRTRGSTSDGLSWIAWASSSLYRPTCRRSTSKKYCLSSRFALSLSLVHRDISVSVGGFDRM